MRRLIEFLSTGLFALFLFGNGAGCMPSSDATPGGAGGANVDAGSGGAGVPPGTGGALGTGGKGTGGAGIGGVGSGGAGTGGRGAGTGGITGSGGTPGDGSGGGTAGRSGGTGGTGTGGRNGTGGAGTGGGGTGGAGNSGSGGRGGTTAGTGGAGGALPLFSFFVTSIEAMRALSGNQNGFGGDLRFGEATGLAGADKICRETAKRSMPGAEAKVWRAFLSATTGGPTGPVNAIDRVGNGPWHDRMGRIVAKTKADLMQTRPRGADTAIATDLPNELGIPNKQGVDNHDTLTGSNSQGMLLSPTPSSTCNDWTSAVGSAGKPMLGHSWPAGSGMSWIQAHAAAGCAPSVNINGSGPPPPGSDGVGSGGGYGGIYCFALTP